MNLNYWLSLGFVFLIHGLSFGQDSTMKAVSLNLKYFAEENKSIYLLVVAKAKIDSRFRPVEDIVVKVYLDKESPDHFISKVVTNENGLAKVVLPVSLKEIWKKSGNHTFLANSEKNNSFESSQTELNITKTKLIIDTLVEDQTRWIKVTAYASDATADGDNELWQPIKELEIKPGVQRLGGILKVTEEDTYITDSAGVILAQFMDTSLPGDINGSIVLAAKVEEHDLYGTLLVTKPANWGKPTERASNFFDQRTLWSTRFRTPWWLLGIVYAMSLGIWATLILVIRSLVKIIKLGQN